MSQDNNPTRYLFVFRFAEDMPDPTPEEMQQMHQKWTDWIQGLRKNGQYVSGDPLEDAPGKVLRGPRGGQATDGPFAEAKEVMGGLIQVTARDFAHAVELARGCPSLGGPFSVEVRQIKPMDI
jgi:hypothetical protein